MAIPGLPGGLTIYQGQLFALKGHLWRRLFFTSLLGGGGKGGKGFCLDSWVCVLFYGGVQGIMCLGHAP